MESDATHRRREAAVHFLRGGCGHRGVREHRIRVGGDDILDGAAVEADGVGVDADPVGVGVRRLHRVREDHAAVDGGIVARLPLPRPDGQFDGGRPDHPHGFVEPDVHGNRLGQLIGVPAVWTGHNLYPRLPRGIHQTSIHFAIGIGRHRAMGERRVDGRIGGVPDRPAVQTDGILGEGDPVRVGVPRLGPVPKVRVAAVGMVERRVPRPCADRQRHLGHADDADDGVEGDRHRNPFSDAVGVATVGAAEEPHASHRRRGRGRRGRAGRHRDGDGVGLRGRTAGRHRQRERQRRGGRQAVRRGEGRAHHAGGTQRDARAARLTPCICQRLALRVTAARAVQRDRRAFGHGLVGAGVRGRRIVGARGHGDGDGVGLRVRAAGGHRQRERQRSVRRQLRRGDEARAHRTGRTQFHLGPARLAPGVGQRPIRRVVAAAAVQCHRRAFGYGLIGPGIGGRRRLGRGGRHEHQDPQNESRDETEGAESLPRETGSPAGSGDEFKGHTPNFVERDPEPLLGPKEVPRAFRGASGGAT